MNWGQAPFCQTAQETALPVTTQIPLEKDGKGERMQARGGREVVREKKKKPSRERENRGRDLRN